MTRTARPDVLGRILGAGTGLKEAMMGGSTSKLRSKQLVDECPMCSGATVRVLEPEAADVCVPCGRVFYYLAREAPRAFERHCAMMREARRLSDE